MHPCIACKVEEGEEGRKGGRRGCLRLLEEPTSPAGAMVVPTGEDSRAVARHARGISAVPAVVVISIRCSSARTSAGATAEPGSMAVVALGHSGKAGAIIGGGRGVLAQAKDESAGRDLIPLERRGAASDGDICFSHRRCGNTEEESGEGEDLDELHFHSLSGFG